MFLLALLLVNKDENYVFNSFNWNWYTIVKDYNLLLIFKSHFLPIFKLLRINLPHFHYHLLFYFILILLIISQFTFFLIFPTLFLSLRKGMNVLFKGTFSSIFAFSLCGYFGISEFRGAKNWKSLSLSWVFLTMWVWWP